MQSDWFVNKNLIRQFSVKMCRRTLKHFFTICSFSKEATLIAYWYNHCVSKLVPFEIKMFCGLCSTTLFQKGFHFHVKIFNRLGFNVTMLKMVRSRVYIVARSRKKCLAKIVRMRLKEHVNISWKNYNSSMRAGDDDVVVEDPFT